MPRLLFVCVEIANRSQMAEGFARFHGGYQVEALSAGANPVGHLSARAIDHRTGIFIHRKRHKSLKKDLTRAAFLRQRNSAVACAEVPRQNR